MFYTCTVAAEKTDGPHPGDRETCGHYKKATLTNYAYTPVVLRCMQEFVPKGSDSESDVFKTVACPMSVKKTQVTMGVSSVYVQCIIFTL